MASKAIDVNGEKFLLEHFSLVVWHNTPNKACRKALTSGYAPTPEEVSHVEDNVNITIVQYGLHVLTYLQHYDVATQKGSQQMMLVLGSKICTLKSNLKI